MVKIVFIRHGESLWNKENRFCGWTDIDLSPVGLDEAKNAGQELKKHGFHFTVTYTSFLKRAIRTLWIILDQLDSMNLPETKTWRLNERHYGGLQGLNKSETAKKHGDEQVKIWRRAYDIPPPELADNDDRLPHLDPKYSGIDKALLPKTESLKLTIERVLPFWFDTIVPAIKSGEKVLVVAHGNSIRALVKYLDNMTETDIMELNIPTGIPLVYELDDVTLKPVKHYYLGDQEEIKKKIEAVAGQGKSSGSSTTK